MKDVMMMKLIFTLALVGLSCSPVVGASDDATEVGVESAASPLWAFSDVDLLEERQASAVKLPDAPAGLEEERDALIAVARADSWLGIGDILLETTAEEEDLLHSLGALAGVLPPQEGLLSETEGTGEEGTEFFRGLQRDDVNPPLTDPVWESLWNLPPLAAEAPQQKEEDAFQPPSAEKVNAPQPPAPSRVSKKRRTRAPLILAEKKKQRQEDNKASAARYRERTNAQLAQLEEWAQEDPALQRKMRTLKERKTPEQLAIETRQAAIEKERNRARAALLRCKETQEGEKELSLKEKIRRLTKQFGRERAKMIRAAQKQRLALYEEEVVKHPESFSEEAGLQVSPVPQQRGSDAGVAEETSSGGEGREEASMEEDIVPPEEIPLVLNKKGFSAHHVAAARKERHKKSAQKHREKIVFRLTQLKEWAQHDPALWRKLREIKTWQRPEQRAIKAEQRVLQEKRDEVRRELFRRQERHANAEELQSLQQKVEEWQNQVDKVSDKMTRTGQALRLALYEEEAAKRQGALPREAAFEVSPVPQQREPEAGGAEEPSAVEGEDVPMEEDSAAPAAATSLEKAFNAAFARSQGAASPEDVPQASTSDGRPRITKPRHKKYADKKEREENKRQRNKKAVKEKREREKNSIQQLELWAKADPDLQQKMQEIEKNQTPEQVEIISARTAVGCERREAEIALKKAQKEGGATETLARKKDALDKQFTNDWHRLLRTTTALMVRLYKDELKKRGVSSSSMEK